MPTTAPSFIGIVVSVDITRPTTAALDDSEISNLENLVAEAYGVTTSDITSVAEYTTSGTMDVTIVDSVSTEEALASLSETLATTLGVSEDSITLSLDLETGEVSYTITTDDHAETNVILEALQDDDVIANLETDESMISVYNVDANDEIIAEINVVINADESLPELQQAENLIDALLGDDYESTTSGT